MLEIALFRAKKNAHFRVETTIWQTALVSHVYPPPKMITGGQSEEFPDYFFRLCACWAHCQKQGSESPLWFFRGIWLSQVRLVSTRNSSHPVPDPLNVIKSPILANTPCISTRLCNGPSLHTVDFYLSFLSFCPLRTPKIVWGKKWLEVNFPSRGEVINSPQSIKAPFFQTLHILGNSPFWGKGKAFSKGKLSLWGKIRPSFPWKILRQKMSREPLPAPGHFLHQEPPERGGEEWFSAKLDTK